MRSEVNHSRIYDIRGDILLGDKAEDGYQLRPHIVWFEEPVPMIEKAASIMTKADIFILIGTSLQVYPAAGLMEYVPYETPKYILDKKIPDMRNYPNLFTIEKPAAVGFPELRKALDQYLKI